MIPSDKLPVHRLPLRLAPDRTRVLIRPFVPARVERIKNVFGRVMCMTDEQVHKQVEELLSDYADRHHHIDDILEEHFENVREHFFTDNGLDRERRLLVGAFFTSEYALEAAALFNPSIVAHPDQSGLPEGAWRFILSLRAVGEGHISSIVFRAGTADADGEIRLDPVSRLVSQPRISENPSYDKYCFNLKLAEMGVQTDLKDQIMKDLPAEFTMKELDQALSWHRERLHFRPVETNRTFTAIEWLAHSNYQIHFRPEQPLSERIIFPYSENESNGMEDARFVRFRDDDGSVAYYATFTAYNGRDALPQLLHTEDFQTFRIITLNGPAASGKGMALFPRRIDGRYAMISRQDGENLYVMYSTNLHFWHETRLIMRPSHEWEYMQLGNCGSPIETDAGWLLLTHGVGPMRRYSISAVLLDREDPSRLLGRLRVPLLQADANEREGYVPNVVYTCGAAIHAGRLLIPYAMSDYATTFATVPLDDLIARLQDHGPGQ